jgi:hypothetical protein
MHGASYGFLLAPQYSILLYFPDPQQLSGRGNAADSTPRVFVCIVLELQSIRSTSNWGSIISSSPTGVLVSLSHPLLIDTEFVYPPVIIALPLSLLRQPILRNLLLT